MNDLQVRIDELESRLRVALAALEAALDDGICPVCWSPMKDGYIHASDCIIDLALSMPPQNIGEK